MKPVQILELVIQAMPNPEHIGRIDVESEDNAVRFSWRGVRFRVSSGLFVEEAHNSMLCGSNLATVVQALLKAKGGDLERGS